MLRNIMEGKYSFSSPEWADISEQPKDLIRRLLVVEPGQRLTATEALHHPFFQLMVFNNFHLSPFHALRLKIQFYRFRGYFSVAVHLIKNRFTKNLFYILGAIIFV